MVMHMCGWTQVRVTYDSPERENSGKYRIVKSQCTPSAYLEPDRLVATSTFPTLPCDAVTWMDTGVTYCSGG